MTFLFFLIFGPFIFLMIRTALGRNENRNLFWLKKIFRIYIAIVILYFTVLFAAQYNYYIKGYRSTSVLFIVMTIVGIIYWLVDRADVFNNIFRGILFCFSIGTIAMSFLLVIEMISDYKKQLIYNDDKYRLEITGRSFIQFCVLPDLFVKNDFYENKFILPDSLVKRYPCLEKSNISNIEIKPVSDSQIFVSYFIKPLKDIPNPLRVQYVIK